MFNQNEISDIQEFMMGITKTESKKNIQQLSKSLSFLTEDQQYGLYQNLLTIRTVVNRKFIEEIFVDQTVSTVSELEQKLKFIESDMKYFVGEQEFLEIFNQILKQQGVYTNPLEHIIHMMNSNYKQILIAKSTQYIQLIFQSKQERMNMKFAEIAETAFRESFTDYLEKERVLKNDTIPEENIPGLPGNVIK